MMKYPSKYVEIRYLFASFPLIPWDEQKNQKIVILKITIPCYTDL